jgi:hypothetical protein
MSVLIIGETDMKHTLTEGIFVVKVRMDRLVS